MRLYLVVHKGEDSQTTSWFAEDKEAFIVARSMLADHGGEIAIKELRPEEVAKLVFAEWMPK